MPEPEDQSQGHGPSGFEPAGEPGGAQRFWGEYARQTRAGGPRHGEGAPGGGPGNGHGTHGATHEHQCLEWCPICRTADVLRAGGSPELRGQLQGLQRDALVTLRDLLDAYLERLGESDRRKAAPVEDIPIE